VLDWHESGRDFYAVAKDPTGAVRFYFYIEVMPEGFWCWAAWAPGSNPLAPLSGTADTAEGAKREAEAATDESEAWR
jgi:hypothetical protein